MPLQITSNRWNPLQYRPSSSLIILCLVLASALGTLILSGWQLPAIVKHYWLWIPALAPATVILHHAVFLSLVNPLTIPVNNTGSTTTTESGGTSDTASVTHEFPEARHYIRSSIQLVWGITAIIRDYTLPIVLNLFAGMVIAYVVCSDGALNCASLAGLTPLKPVEGLEPELAMGHGQALTGSVVDGIRYGAVGAYVYVLMLLGNRTFQRDITPGIALWCGVQLLLGPILGGTAATILAESTQLNEFTQYAVYFMAGLAPRELMNFIQQAASKMWTGDRAAVDESNLSPLSQIRGISPAVIERFAEESITDTTALAMANPLRMIRDMPYEFRQVLAWMDEALLYYFLADKTKVEKLQRLGFSGAIDLAYCHVMDGPSSEMAELLSKQLDPQTTDPEQVAIQTALLRGLIRRMYEDRQVQSIWVLYQADFDGLNTNV